MLNYLVIGAGSTGLALGAYLLSSDKNVSFVARGETLKKIRNDGIILDSNEKGMLAFKDVNIYAPEEINRSFDVIFVCVKYYSLMSVIDIVSRASDGNTIVIPLVNVYGASEELQAKLPNTCVLDGCMFVVSDLLEAGKAKLYGDTFNIIYGERGPQLVELEHLEEIKNDLQDAGINAKLSENIRSDIFKDYSFNCAYATVGAFHDVKAEAMQRIGSLERSEFSDLILEMISLGKALEIDLGQNFLNESLEMLKSIPAETTASMQKDIAEGKDNEMDGLTFRPVRLGKVFDVDMPVFEKIAKYYGCGRRKG